jgi:hypothetical protein
MSSFITLQTQQALEAVSKPFDDPILVIFAKSA